MSGFHIEMVPISHDTDDNAMYDSELGTSSDESYKQSESLKER
jgi:hypothetical protein